MEVVRSFLEETLLWNKSILLIILEDRELIESWEHLRIYGEQDARVKCLILRNDWLPWNFNGSIVVNIGNSTENSKILRNSWALNLNHTLIGRVEYSSLLGIVSCKDAIWEHSLSSLIVGK